MNHKFLFVVLVLFSLSLVVSDSDHEEIFNKGRELIKQEVSCDNLNDAK